MRISFANTFVVGLLALALVKPPLMTAGDTNLTDWQNFKQLVAGQEIEVTTSSGRSVQGAFISFSNQSIILQRTQQAVTIPRTDVLRVRLRQAHRRRYTWIGAALGAGAGAGIGAGIG